jgi:hypothetical protein
MPFDDSPPPFTPRPPPIRPMPDDDPGLGCLIVIIAVALASGVALLAVYFALRHAPAILGLIGFGFLAVACGLAVAALRRALK